jgi:hypothetical protein
MWDLINGWGMILFFLAGTFLGVCLGAVGMQQRQYLNAKSKVAFMNPKATNSK